MTYTSASSDDQRASDIIHNSAIAAAAASGGLAQTASLGGDNALIIPIVSGMIVALGQLYGLSLEKVVNASIVGEFMKPALGITGATKAIVGLIPIIGNVSNAFITFRVTKIIGWAVYSVFKDQKDIDKLKPEEIQAYIKTGKSLEKRLEAAN